MMHEQDPATRRTVERVATNFPGRVIIPGRPPLHCQVVDMSENGALLEFRAAIWLPPRFHLNIDAMDTEAYCEVRHQRSNRVGVTFKRVTVKDPAEPAPVTTARRTADHWDAAESETHPTADHVQDDGDLAPMPEPVPHMPQFPTPSPASRQPRTSANTSPHVTQAMTPPLEVDRPVARAGSAIRANVRATKEQLQADSKQAGLIGRLFGR